MIVSQDTASKGRFSFRSDRLCLDFAATLMFRDTDHPKELLDSPATFSAWALAGVLSTPMLCGSTELNNMTALREAIYRLAVARIGGHSAAPADLDVLNRHGGLAPVRVALRSDGLVSRSG